MIVTDGKSHDVDSSEMAFRTASTLAFKQGVNKAGSMPRNIQPRDGSAAVVIAMASTLYMSRRPRHGKRYP